MRIVIWYAFLSCDKKKKKKKTPEYERCHCNHLSITRLQIFANFQNIYIFFFARNGVEIGQRNAYIKLE